MSTETTERPDLSAVETTVRRRVLTAEIMGAKWGPHGDRRYDFALYMPGEGAAFVWAADGEHRTFRILPDYEEDPAAWGALMEKELNGYDTSSDGRVWCWWYTEGRRDIKFGPTLPSLPEAVCAAVLAKHGIDWTTLEQQ